MHRIGIYLVALLAASLPVVFDSALKGTILLAFVAIAAVCMRNASAAARHLAWMLGIVGLLLLPLLSAILPGWRVLPQWAGLPVPARTGERSSPSSTLSLPAQQGLVESITTNDSITRVAPSDAFTSRSFLAGRATSPLHDAFSHRDNALWLSGAWISVAALLLLRLGTSVLLLRMRFRAAAAVTEGPLQDALEAACDQLQLRQCVRLFVEDRRIVPLVWGVFRPRLVLPAEAREWEPARLRAVLLHELAHVKRRDVLVMLLTQIACAVHWFNPLAWLTAWRLHVERERACDNLVLTSGVKASDYAEHLLHVATRLETASPAGALAMARPSRLEGRLMAVLNQQLKRGGVTRSITLLAAAISLSIIIPVAMLRAQDKPAISRDAEAVGGREVIQRSIATEPATPGETTTKPINPGAADTDVNGQKVPILGDIPLLGRLFGGKADPFDRAVQTLAAAFPKAVKPDGKRAIVRGRLLDPAGNPIPKRVIWIVGTRDGERVTFQDGPTGPDGRFEFSDVPVGVAWEVFLPKDDGPDGFVSQSMKLSDERERELDLRFSGETVEARLVPPVADNPPPNDTPEKPQSQHVIEVKADGSLTFDATVLSYEALAEKLTASAVSNPKDAITVRAEKNAPYTSVAKVLEACRSAGIANVAIAAITDEDKQAAKVSVTSQSGKTHTANPTSELARARLDQAERELERISELNHQKIVSQQELERAKAEVEIRKAELAGDSSAVMRTRLEQAERDLGRLSELNKQKLVSQQELDRAKAEVDIRKAELAGDAAGVMRTRLQLAERELERLGELNKQKLVSQAELDRAKFEVDLRRAELAGDPVQFRRTRLQQAQHDLELLTPLYEQKLVSQQEIEEAKANVDLRIAEFIGDRALATGAGLKHAEAELDRASRLRAEKLISEAEYEALRYKVEVARAQLQQSTSETRPKASAHETSSNEVLQQLDEAIKLANEKLALLKRQQAEASADAGQANPPAPATGEKIAATTWQPFSQERVDQALKAGRPVFIQFTADWSVASRTNERRVLNTAAVSSAFTGANVLTLKADWTDGNAVVTEWLRKFPKPGVPLYLLYMPGKAEPYVFPGVLTSEDIVHELSKIKK